jgi:hypothetical protein
VKTLLAACALLGGCALLQPPPPKPAPTGPSLGELISKLSIGKSTKTEVRAALGEATVVDFPSGYEVWVYRQPAQEKPPVPAAELVLLFDPTGTLAKTRVR